MHLKRQKKNKMTDTENIKISLNNFEEYFKIIHNLDVAITKPSIIDENKYNCVFGVLCTLDGVKIKDSFIDFLEKYFNVWVVEQSIINNLYEYPFLKYFELLVKETKQSCLYIHSKGAGRKHDIQEVTRLMWKSEIKNHKDWYFNIIKSETDKIVSTMYTGSVNKNTWFNCFVVNKNVFNDFTIELNEDRYFYECLFRNYKDIKVIGRLSNDIECFEHNMEEDLLKIYNSTLYICNNYLFNEVTKIAPPKQEIILLENLK